MTRICSVTECPYSSTATSSATPITFHMIPKRASNQIRDIWTKFCCRAPESTTIISICSLHFAESDYNKPSSISHSFGVRRNLNKDAVPSIMPSNIKAATQLLTRPTPQQQAVKRIEREFQSIEEGKKESSILEKEIADMRIILDKKILRLSKIHQRLDYLERRREEDLMSRIDEVTRKNTEILNQTVLKPQMKKLPAKDVIDVKDTQTNEIELSEFKIEPEVMEEEAICENPLDTRAIDPFDSKSEFVECVKQEPIEVKTQPLKYVFLTLGPDQIPSLCSIPKTTSIVKLDNIKSPSPTIVPNWTTPKISGVFSASKTTITKPTTSLMAPSTTQFPSTPKPTYIKLVPQSLTTIQNTSQSLINKKIVLKSVDIEAYIKKQMVSSNNVPEAKVPTPPPSSSIQEEDENEEDSVAEDYYSGQYVNPKKDPNPNSVKKVKEEPKIVIRLKDLDASTFRAVLGSRTGLQIRPQLECDICKRKFHTNEQLHRHRNTHPFNDPPLTCDKCGKTFDMKQYLWNHMHKVHSIVRPICPTCGKICISYSGLTRHLRTHSSEKRYTCEKCGKGFNYQHHLVNHRYNHLNLRPYMCSICGLGFTRKDNMLTHTKTHTKKDTQILDSYKCPTCLAKFSTEEEIKQHGNICDTKSILYRNQRVKNSERKLKCPMGGNCSFRCCFEGTMKGHLTNKHGLTLTPMTCLCHATTFETKEECDKHRFEHRDQFKFACEVCKILFKTEEKMKKHVATLHDEYDVRPYKCFECGGNFKRPEHLKSHIAHKHSKEEPKFKCDLCKFKGKYKVDLNAHLKIHFDYLKHSCRICGRKFSNVNCLRKHIQAVHGIENMYKCDCGETFYYLVELNLHKKQQCGVEVPEIAFEMKME